MVPQVEKEIKNLFGKSTKDYKDYLLYLASQLKIVEDASDHLTEYPFEQLKTKGADLFRIKSKSKRKNARVIYCYWKDDKIVLLCAFEEKSSSDYENSIRVAIDRFKHL